MYERLREPRQASLGLPLHLTGKFFSLYIALFSLSLSLLSQIPKGPDHRTAQGYARARELGSANVSLAKSLRKTLELWYEVTFDIYI